MTALVELAREILRNALIIENGEYQDDCGANASIFSNKEVDHARAALLDATHKLQCSAQSPEAYMFQQLWSVTDVFVLKMIYAFNLPQFVPLNGSIDCATIAASMAVPCNTLARLFRYAITIGFFTEPVPGQVAHSDVTRMLVTNVDAFDALGMITQELCPSTENFPAALQQFAGSEEPNETAYNIANSTDLAIYDFLAEHPERNRRFGAAMQFFSGDDSSYFHHLLGSFPWKSGLCDRDDFLVVDVGGGIGSVSIKLAGTTNNMRFIVQDKEEVVEEGRALLPEALQDRISFAVHDFFTPMTVVADVYFFRWIFHNWSDKYCVQILQNLVPALKNGARILIYEHIMDEGVNMQLSKKRERYLDLIMMVAFNSRERTREDWKNLFAAADSRFLFQDVTKLPGASLSLIEAVWIS